VENMNLVNNMVRNLSFTNAGFAAIELYIFVGAQHIFVRVAIINNLQGII
jgi:hypothetical protein